MTPPEHHPAQTGNALWRPNVPVSTDFALLTEGCLPHRPTGEGVLPSDLVSIFEGILKPLEPNYERWTNSLPSGPERLALLDTVCSQLVPIMQTADAKHLVRYLLDTPRICFPGGLLEVPNLGGQERRESGVSAEGVACELPLPVIAPLWAHLNRADLSFEERDRVFKIFGNPTLFRLFAGAQEVENPRVAAELAGCILKNVDPSMNSHEWDWAGRQCVRIAQTAPDESLHRIQSFFSDAVAWSDEAAEFIVAHFDQNALEALPYGRVHQMLVRSVVSCPDRRAIGLALRLLCDRNIRMPERAMLIDSVDSAIANFPQLTAFLSQLQGAASEKDQATIVRYGSSIRGYASGYWGEYVPAVFEQVLRVVTRGGSSLQEQHALSPNIPAHTFPFLYAFCDGDQKLLAQANEVYVVVDQALSQGSGENRFRFLRAALHSALVRAALAPPLVHHAKLEELRRLGPVSPARWFAHTIEACRILCETRHPDYAAIAARRLLSSDNMSRCLTRERPLADMVTLSGDVRESLKIDFAPTEAIVQELFRRYQIPQSVLAGLMQSWQSLSPLVHLLQPHGVQHEFDYSQYVTFLKEMLSHLDAPHYRHFSDWRYGLRNPVVASQIGFLSDEGRKVWTTDTVALCGAPAHRDANGEIFPKFAVVVTGDPEVLAHIGKYPVGFESCSAYDAGFLTARSLLSYMGDAHIRVAVTLSLEAMRDNDPELFKRFMTACPTIGDFSIREVDGGIETLLGYSVSRTILKLARDNGGKPVIALQPTFTIQHPDGKSLMPPYVTQIGVRTLLADPLRAEMVTTCLHDFSDVMSIQIPASRSPFGQLENMDHLGWLAQTRAPYGVRVGILRR